MNSSDTLLRNNSAMETGIMIKNGMPAKPMPGCSTNQTNTAARNKTATHRSARVKWRLRLLSLLTVLSMPVSHHAPTATSASTTMFKTIIRRPIPAHFFKNALNKSIGSGRNVVVLCSLAISRMVWR